MNRILRTTGLVALVACAAGVSISEAQAGGRRHCHCQQMTVAPAMSYSSTAPAVVYSNGVASNGAAPHVSADGRERYQSAYQAPVAQTAPVYVAPAPVYYGNNYYRDNTYYGPEYRPQHFQDRTFQQQNSADRKIRGL